MVDGSGMQGQRPNRQMDRFQRVRVTLLPSGRAGQCKAKGPRILPFHLPPHAESNGAAATGGLASTRPHRRLRRSSQKDAAARRGRSKREDADAAAAWRRVVRGISLTRRPAPFVFTNQRKAEIVRTVPGKKNLHG